MLSTLRPALAAAVAAACFAFALARPAPALASEPAQVQQGEVHVETLALPPAQQGPDEPLLRDEDHGPWMTMQLFFDGIDPLELGRGYGNPEITAIAGEALPPAALGGGRTVTGGLMFGMGARPKPWLRIPELRLYVGGGPIDGRWTPLQGEHALEARAERVLLLRAELTGGFQVRLGPVTPYAIARLGASGWFMRTGVRHETLEGLGTERIVDGEWEAGLEAGLEIAITEELRATAAYRQGWLGPTTHGATIGIVGNTD